MTIAVANRLATDRRLRPNLRGRVAGLHTRQERQKLDSRQRILDAARTVIATLPYALIAVEDVIAEAQVSRTTFYRHFESKFAIFRELHKPFLDALYQVYDGLGLCADPTEAQICDWVRTFLDFYRSEIILVTAYSQIYAIEPDFIPIAEAITETICRRLAPTLPAIRRSLGDGDAAMMAKIEIHLLLQNINDFGTEAVVRKWGLDTEMATIVMARRIRAFLRDYATA